MRALQRSRRRSTNPERTPHQAATYALTSTTIGAVATLAATSTSVNASARSERSDVASTTIAYGPPSGVHRIMEREEREHHVVENRRRAQYEIDYGHPEGPAHNPDRQPRSQVVVVARDDDAARVGGNGDDMAITAFPALAPRLRSVAYPNNFKHNIQKYDGRSDPTTWLSTYYVAVKVAGGNFDHMVMGDAPSLWLNNLSAGSITSWADLS
jgi:hypothetical protein